ncbi:bifunctional 4-hydroxy-2-oxoglutarate aldolase/2-dehydro-3-deoxy-phosphogluconate aldolase [Dactylosporangium sp. NPDC051541]|uniref:bifunctional 4-hydroxy-2-oxoglutarate aldolase/2-dehydro-3-deoxy-phosphogluconate aldolase n=1 Tax=Dactylosporangium sp. NPDC051541 TaxID=3363977 RepID=UPI0037958183
MTAEDEVLEALRRHRIVAIVRAPDAGTALRRARDLLAAGLRVVEISLTTPGAWTAIESLAEECAGRDDVTIGVGTVLSPADAARAAAAGARFVIAPTLDRSVIAAARDGGLAAIPGCATPTEMWRATRWGATAVKIFPATLWTPRALAGVLEALPDLRCVPTGGIGPDDVDTWVAAGALAVGIGSALTRPAVSDPSRPEPPR